MGMLALLSGLGSAYSFLFSNLEAGTRPLAIVPLALAPLGLSAGSWVLVAPGRDLAQMRRGAMDPGGMLWVSHAQGPALGGLILNAAFLLVGVATCLRWA